jgi:hypothetical protein
VRALSSCLAAAITLVSAISLEGGDRPAPTEHEVKAAFLYNFAKFVKWPDDATQGPRFVIAVLGDDPFGEVLEKTFAGKTLLERPVEIRRCKTVTAAKESQILFIGTLARGRLDEVFRILGSAGVLTVGESDGFTDQGGMIGFRMSEGTVHFEINLDRVEAAGLKMSSQLIRLAQRVKSAGGGV